MLLLLLFLLPSAALATEYSPAYRVKTALDENNPGYTGLTVTITLPRGEDIRGVGPTGAAYNYIGLETADGHNVEIGLHKDTYDAERGQWSVFAMATYPGAYTYYGSEHQWHNFRKMYRPDGPDLVFPDGSVLTMALEVTAPNEVTFTVTGQEPVRLVLPGAEPHGTGQIFRRVTSLMSDDALGYSKNNLWQDMKIKKAGESWQEWLPSALETLRSNNMDKGDPRKNWIAVRSGKKPFPENIDIIMREKPSSSSSFKVGALEYCVDGETRTADAGPLIEGNRVYLPVRFLGYACGIQENEIYWDDQSKSATLTAQGSTIRLTIGQPWLDVNNEIQPIDAVPLLQEGRAYLPARFVAEALGYYVEWNPEGQTVFIWS
jgi:hypothetical protein